MEGPSPDGPSGAGKSSVLDAMAAVLVAPGKLRFNAAAQGTDTRDHDRNLVTYVRGAHKREADEETGEVGAAFLRKGPTWSGIALTFVDEAGAATTLLRLFHISGSSTQREDLKSLFAVAPGEVDLLSLQGYVANGIESRQLKAAFPTGTPTRPTGTARSPSVSGGCSASGRSRLRCCCTRPSRPRTSRISTRCSATSCSTCPRPSTWRRS
ncbi:ATP-binding protein [Tessaracoccus coleopterorum]|uniref:ATP-binding protein n=1 Tax=Tessaracoccus coleopterorum TaxID=2714950 RepID=UPI002F91B16F